jgi:thiamine-monophosphate kinase
MAARLGEFDRIARFLKPLAKGLEGALALADDAGLIRLPGAPSLVATTDAMVEGVHYLPDADPFRLARKLLRVNLSDLAAMGAAPLAYLLTTALPARIADDWLERFAAGLARDQARYGIALLGGDSVSTEGPVVLSVTALGRAEGDRVLRRSGARPGDAIFVTGTLGDGALGLKAARGELAGLAEAHIAALAARYHLPTPRVALGRRLVGLASAAIDVSDGLPGDLGHICRASGVAARVQAASVPLSDAARAAVAHDPALLQTALAGGDDYELLFTLPPDRRAALAELAGDLDLQVTEIGVIGEGEGLAVLDAEGRAVPGLKGWSHF